MYFNNFAETETLFLKSKSRQNHEQRALKIFKEYFTEYKL